MNSMTFLPGIQVDNKFTFQKDSHEAKLKICKKETRELTYKLAITYFGVDKNNQPEWEVQINDRIPSFEGKKLHYKGSKSFKIEFSEVNIIKITEKDEYSIGVFDINTSDETYVASFCYSVDNTRWHVKKGLKQKE